MRVRTFAAIVAIAWSASGAWGQFWAADDAVGIARVTQGEARRQSTSDPNWQHGNGDARPIAPGDTLVIADLAGPGVITHLWNTIASSEKYFPRLLLLRFYWDGEEQPSIEVPLGDFFGVGHGLNVPLESQMVAVSSDGMARNCYWPMPFAKSARVTVTNEGKEPINAFYSYVDWVKLDRLPKDAGYFHACYHQEFPARPHSRFAIADIRGQGRYVGTVFSNRQRVDGWMGEGDDFFYVDGDTEPTLRGTGTEDYFCDAWGFRKFTYPFYGVPVFEGYEAGDRTSAYRWHIADPIPFQKSLKVEIEHVGPMPASPYDIRPDDVSTVAFWYQKEPHSPFRPIPHGYDRLYPEKLTGDLLADVRYPEYIAAVVDGWIKQKANPLAIIRLDDAMVKTTGFSIDLKNSTSGKEEFDFSIPAFNGLTFTPNPMPETVEPKAAKTVRFDAVADPPVSAEKVSIIPCSVTARLVLPNGQPEEAAADGIILLDAPFPIHKAPRHVEVDGRLDEWQTLPIKVSTPAEVRIQSASWTGPEDSSFAFVVAADQRFLYVAVDVVDDAVTEDRSEPVWGRDAIEFRLLASPDPFRSTFGAYMKEGDGVLIGVVPEAPDSGDQLASPAYFPNGTRYACVKTDKGFSAEFAIPQTYLDDQQGGPWRAVRINVAVDDRDPDGKLSQIWWRPDWRHNQTFDGSGTFVRK